MKVELNLGLWSNAQDMFARTYVHKRYLLTIDKFNLSILMRKLIDAGTLKGATAITLGILLCIQWVSSFISIFEVLVLGGFSYL